MYLRSLELEGFKSFPDKTKLTFTRGISAIVGPNGSGKSNIGDAMRWVLGEKSSKSLRGETMDDVIFAGTRQRQASRFAQVTLTIDNEDRALNSDSDIVSVSRKLYRNGSSEYQINGSQVRLKDVEELFMDTGLGRNGYSIISQGKIAEIVSSKASERRRIFDEAAGISKFRSKKEETELRLLKAEDNISRLTDILSELESRIGPLKKQCEKAKQFRTLDDEKSALETALWTQRLDELIKLQKESEEKLQLLKSQYEDISGELDKLEEDIENGFARAAEQGELANDRRREIHEIELSNSQSAARTAVLENDIGHLEEQIAQIKENIERAKNGGELLNAQLDERTRELERLKEKRGISAEGISQCEAELSAAADELSERGAETERISERISELRLSGSAAEFRLESAKNNESAALESMNALSAQKDEQSRLRAEYRTEKEKLSAELKKLEERKSEISNRISGFTRLWESRSKKLSAARDDFSANDIKLREIDQRLDILRDLENAMDGFSYSVKYIMNASAKGRIPGICGTIAQLISVEPKYSTAIETALGGALQNIAVENESSAKRAMRLLLEENRGRATFMPLTSVKGNKLNTPPVGEEGYISLASELAGCDTRYSQLIDYLLGKTAVVEDIDCASDIAKKYGYKFKIVTLDGQVVNAGGTYTGGSVSKSAGLLTRKNEITELKKSKDKLSRKNAELKASCEELSQEVQRLAAQLEGEKEGLSAADADILRNTMESERVDELLGQLDGGEERLEENLRKLEEQLKTVQDMISSAAREIGAADSQIKECETELEEKRGESAAAAKRRDELAEKLARLRIADAECVKDIDVCREAIGRIRASIESGRGDESRFAEEIAECERKIDERRAEIKATEDSVKGSGDRIAALEDKIRLALAAQTQLNNEAEKLRAEQKNKMNERETLSGEISRLSERNESIKGEFDKLAGRLWDEYGLTRSEAQEKCTPPEDEKAAKLRLDELRSQIKALGNVNLGAIEEYAEVSERYEFMSAQLADVNRSRVELAGLIDELTENMRSVFTESFEKIGARFSEIFTEMFGGGKAVLSLTDPENVLECGIDIDVAPPGKVVKNLLILSGGEQSFVAMCIYFAILSVRPSPFCLLDEIEAALDEVNVGKFAAYMHKFTDKTQFITITHKRRTMEEADVLYGVTMQEDGITKLLKMDLETVQKTAQ